MLRFKIAINGVSGSPYLCTLHFSGTTQGDIATPRAAVVAFFQALDNHWGNSTNWSLDPEVEFVDPVTGNITGTGTAVTATGAGSLSALYLPPATQALIKWRTGIYRNGREIQGKTFVPGMVTADATGAGTPSATLLADYNTAAAALAATTPQTLVVWSKRNGEAQNVQSGVMLGKYAVLRSRRD